jgi:predicted DNA binding protein
MLRQVVLSVSGPNLFKDLATKHGCTLNILDCKNFNSHGTSLLIQIEGEKSPSLIEELRSSEGVKRVYFGESEGRRNVIMVVLEAPPYCYAVQQSGAFCISCPFKNDGVDRSNETSWKLMMKDSAVLAKTMDTLESKGIQATLKDISSARLTGILTSRQREVILQAMKLGYFDFPRKKDLTQLAQDLSIRPSTLSEIMRRAESKMAKFYLESVGSG